MTCPGEVEIRGRLPAWCALSRLFLGVELDESDRSAIARAIASAGFSRRAARAILEREVAPAFYAHLLAGSGMGPGPGMGLGLDSSTPGEGAPGPAGWPEDVVRDRVLAHLRAGWLRRCSARIAARQLRWMYRLDWEKVAAQLPA